MGTADEVRGPTTKPLDHAIAMTCKPVPAEARRHLGRTMQPPLFESLIALRPAGSAFFSLVFFADAKKSDRQPPQGDVV
ncbi:hypothetical protein OR16_41399, partial [Cupriavidus basilensis OR16]